MKWKWRPRFSTVAAGSRVRLLVNNQLLSGLTLRKLKKVKQTFWLWVVSFLQQHNHFRFHCRHYGCFIAWNKNTLTTGWHRLALMYLRADVSLWSSSSWTGDHRGSDENRLLFRVLQASAGATSFKIWLAGNKNKPDVMRYDLTWTCARTNPFKNHSECLIGLEYKRWVKQGFQI